MIDDSLTKSYANDWAKSKSRDLVKDMIANTLLTYRKPQDLRVLCFPGQDAQEIFDVYDRLGIPRGNIVGVERDPRIAAEIEAKKLGIRVVPTTIEDYFNREKTLGFDVISLDYVGPMSINQIQTINAITSKSDRSNVVIHSANSTRRERDLSEMIAYGIGFSDPRINKLSLDIDDVSENLHGLLKDVHQAIAEQSSDTSDYRPKAYSGLISNALSNTTIFSMEPILTFATGQNLKQHLQKFRYQFADIPNGEKIMSLTDDVLLNDFSFAAAVYSSMVNACYRGLRLKLANNGVLASARVRHVGMVSIVPRAADLFNEMLPIEVLKALSRYVHSDALIVNKRLGYSYISESGTPMIGEIVCASKNAIEFKKAKELALNLGFPEKFSVRESPHKIRSAIIDFATYASKKVSDASNYKKIRSIPNIYLGNSARPIITKSRAIAEFKTGASVDDVQTKYRGWTNKPLAQWKAHVSMGTYDLKPAAELTAEELDVEKISREEAYDLLDSGIPPKEVFRAYPTSFKIGQLRAFAAHITMRREKESKNEEAA